MTNNLDGWIVFDHAEWMLDVKDFSLEGKTGIGALGEFMGWKMGVNDNGWICKEVGLAGIRWRHWKKIPITREVEAYTGCDQVHKDVPICTQHRHAAEDGEETDAAADHPQDAIWSGKPVCGQDNHEDRQQGVEHRPGDSPAEAVQIT